MSSTCGIVDIEQFGLHLTRLYMHIITSYRNAFTCTTYRSPFISILQECIYQHILQECIYPHILQECIYPRPHPTRVHLPPSYKSAFISTIQFIYQHSTQLSTNDLTCENCGGGNASIVLPLGKRSWRS